MFLSRLAPFALALVLVPHQVAAQAATQPASPAKKPGWVVDYGEKRCTMLREVAADPSYVFGLRIRPAYQGVELFVVNSAWNRDPIRASEDFDVILNPGGIRYAGEGTGTVIEYLDRRIAIADPDLTFLASLAKATSVSLVRGKKGTLEVPLGSSAKAVAAVRKCQDDILAEWGLDTKLRDSLKKQPKGDPRSFFSAGDYPASSLSKNAQGEVVVLYTIADNGRVKDCKVVESSGDAPLDYRSCAVLKQRARFTPAIGPDDKPVEVKQIIAVTWAIPA